MRACRLPAKSRVLALPCGQLVEPLVADGYRVTAADDSPARLDQARLAWSRAVAADPDLRGTVQFDLTDLPATRYADNAFDACIADHALSHLHGTPQRIAALTELRRITRQWVIASFSNLATLEGLRFRLRAWLKVEVPSDPAPITLHQLRADASAAGLSFSAMIATRGPVSARCYAILRKPACVF